MTESEFYGLILAALLAVWPLLVLAVLAFTVSCIVLWSLYEALRGFVRDELELYYLQRRADDVVQEARERAGGAVA